MFGAGPDDMDKMEDVMKLHASVDMFEDAVTGNTVADAACDDDGDISDKERSVYNAIEKKIWRKEIDRQMENVGVDPDLKEHLNGVIEHLEEDSAGDSISPEDIADLAEESFEDAESDEEPEGGSLNQDEAVDIGFDGGSGDGES